MDPSATKGHIYVRSNTARDEKHTFSIDLPYIQKVEEISLPINSYRSVFVQILFQSFSHQHITASILRVSLNFDLRVNIAAKLRHNPYSYQGWYIGNFTAKF